MGGKCLNNKAISNNNILCDYFFCYISSTRNQKVYFIFKIYKFNLSQIIIINKKLIVDCQTKGKWFRKKEDKGAWLSLIFKGIRYLMCFFGKNRYLYYFLGIFYEITLFVIVNAFFLIIISQTIPTIDVYGRIHKKKRLYIF